VIAAEGVLGATVDDVVVHIVRETLHRDWLIQTVARERLPKPVPPAPSPAKNPPTTAVAAMKTYPTEKRLLRMPEVCRQTGLGRSSVYRLIKLGLFPAPRKLGERSVAWYQREIDTWVESGWERN
jgi:predicted DNA-binding transcriptional regulator AlpA